MHPSWLGGVTKNCPLPAHDLRSSRSIFEATEASKTTSIQKPTSQRIVACWFRGQTESIWKIKNGAVDGFPCMVIWLHTYSTNSNPRVIVGHFTDEVENRSSTPTRIRSDLGTENCSGADNHEEQFSDSSNHSKRIKQGPFPREFFYNNLIQFTCLEIIEVGLFGFVVELR